MPLRIRCGHCAAGHCRSIHDCGDDRCQCECRKVEIEGAAEAQSLRADGPVGGPGESQAEVTRSPGISRQPGASEEGEAPAAPTTHDLDGVVPLIGEVEQLLTDYSRWLRERTRLQSIDEHVEITTPYLDRHNDYLQIYVRRSDDGYVLTDDGYVIDDLRTAGCEITTPKRRQILETVLNGFGVHVAGEALQVDATQKNFALRKHNLVQAMLAISDIFLVAAMVLFVLAAFNVGSPRFNLTAAGLACWLISTQVS